jgi:isopenicillin N synthase-like dioxygenase
MSAFDHLPVLDLDEAHNPRTKPQFMNALLDAVVNVGFFYLKNTIPASIEDEMVQKSIELLNLCRKRRSLRWQIRSIFSVIPGYSTKLLLGLRTVESNLM